MIQKDRREVSAACGGAAILVSHEFKHKVKPVLDLVTDLEIVAVKILRPGQHDLIVHRKTKPYKYNLLQRKLISQNWLEILMQGIQSLVTRKLKKWEKF